MDDAAVSTVVLLSTLLMISTNQGSKLTMISWSKDLIVDIQDTVAFECSFHFQAVAYNLFEYPLIWRKTQGHEDIQINMMSNVNEPFAATNRFQVSFDTDHPNYTLKLTIKEIRHEDSGNYTCEVRGPSSNVLGKVVYYLFVREAINRIILTDNVMLDNFDQDNTASLDVINLVENRQSTLRCISIGGSPPPKIDLYIGEEKITHDVNFRRNFTLLGNERGLKIMKHYSEKSIVKYRPTSDDSGKEFKCVAVVPSFKQYVHAVKISVDYAPKISCTDTHSYLGEKNVYIKCEISSKPAIKSLRWIIDSNQTELTEGKVVNDFWTLVIERQSNLLETRLYIRQAKENVFQNYTLMVDNAIASTTKNVTLYKKHTRRIGSTIDRQPTRVEITDASHETNGQMLYKSGQDKLPYICTFYLGLNTNIFLYFIVHYL